jgi:hypothetical protein
MMKKSINRLVLVGLILTCSYTVYSQISGKAGSEPVAQLSDSQKSLAEGSKKALLKTGMSETYFNKHFRLVEVFDKPGDRRVVWKFLINGYEATINDSIGHYTEGGKQIYIHSVANTLSSTTDIERTIPRARALRIMRSCLGKFTDPSIEYRAGGAGRAQLLLIASSAPKPIRRRQEAREREERNRESSRKKATQAGGKAETDVIEEEDEDGSPVYIASVNLETGKCTKGRAEAGPPKTNLLLRLN